MEKLASIIKTYRRESMALVLILIFLPLLFGFSLTAFGLFAVLVLLAFGVAVNHPRSQEPQNDA